MKWSIRLKSMRVMKKLQEGQINKHWWGRWYFKFEYSNRRLECFSEATSGAYYLVLQKELNGFKCDQCKFILINSDDRMKKQKINNEQTHNRRRNKKNCSTGKQWSLQVFVWQEWHQSAVTLRNHKKMQHKEIRHWPSWMSQMH